jgi:hypothetical protein
MLEKHENIGFFAALISWFTYNVGH